MNAVAHGKQKVLRNMDPSVKPAREEASESLPKKVIVDETREMTTVNCLQDIYFIFKQNTFIQALYQAPSTSTF